MKLAHYSTVAENQRIDKSLGIIFGVSVITLGRAQGHNMQIDDKTLEQILAVAKTHKDGLKVKFGYDHKAGVEDTIGALKDFRLDGDQVRADLHLLQSCTQRAQILEMAEKLPNEFGLSAVFTGEHEEKEKVKFARCQEIYSVDLVSDPAANPNGLFSKKTGSGEEEGVALEMDGKTHKKDCMCADCKKKMSDKDKKKSMSEILTPEFVTELKKLMGTDTTELAKRVEAFEAANREAVKLAKKTEIANLISEASRDGKVVPLTDAQLEKLDIGEIKEIIGKCPKAQVQMSRGHKPAPPTKADGTPIAFDRSTPEGRAQVIEFCRRKQAENIAALNSEVFSTTN